MYLYYAESSRYSQAKVPGRLLPFGKYYRACVQRILKSNLSPDTLYTGVTLWAWVSRCSTLVKQQCRQPGIAWLAWGYSLSWTPEHTLKLANAYLTVLQPGMQWHHCADEVTTIANQQKFI